MWVSFFVTRGHLASYSIHAIHFLNVCFRHKHNHKCSIHRHRCTVVLRKRIERAGIGRVIKNPAVAYTKTRVVVWTRNFNSFSKGDRGVLVVSVVKWAGDWKNKRTCTWRKFDQNDSELTTMPSLLQITHDSRTFFSPLLGIVNRLWGCFQLMVRTPLDSRLIRIWSFKRYLGWLVERDKKWKIKRNSDWLKFTPMDGA